MLEIRGLTRRFGNQTVLDNIDLDIPTGEVACLVGPSGCGKSTLLRLVAGLDRPDQGTITLNGRTISSPGWALEPHKRQLNMVFQDYALWPHMNVETIVGYGLDRMERSARKTRVRNLLEQLQIAPLARRLPSQISGGQQQRVAIARALATDPDLLLFDEPLSNLDVQLRLEMRKEFSTLFGSVGKTVLYVTHDPLEAASFADTLVVMNKGEIEQTGAPDALFAAPCSPWIATLAGFDTTMAGIVQKQLDADAMLVQIGDQSIRVELAADRRLQTAPPGSAVSIMLAADSFTVTGGHGGGSQNQLTGTVSHSLFEGRFWRLVVKVGDNAVSAIASTRLAIGAPVTLSFPYGSALAFLK